MSIEPHNSTRSKKPRAVDRRKEQIYELHLKGWSQTEIAESLQVDQSTVSRAIASVRHGNSWFNKSARERFGNIIDDTRDMALQTIRESWRMYHSSELADKPETRAVYLGRVQNGIKIVTDFVPDADALRIEEQMELLKEQHEKIERMIEEARQKDKVQLPPYPSWPQIARNG